MPLPFRVRPLALALTGLLASSLANAQSSTAVAVRDATATLADQAVTLPFTVVRDGDTDTAVSVRYTTVDGSARAGEDYRPASGTATIAAGRRSVTIPVVALGQPAGTREAGRFGLRLLQAFATAGAVDQLAFGTGFSGATAGNIWGLTSADFNADGRPDLALANLDDGMVDLLANTTDAGAASARFRPMGQLAHVSSPGRPVACDLNNDGRPDLAVPTGSTNRASVYLNTTAPGSGGFSFERTDLDSLPWGWMQQMACADVDGDGRLDLVGAGSGSNNAPGTNRLIVFRNLTPTGVSLAHFASPLGFAAHPSHDKSLPETIAVGDFNLDGRPDAAIGHFASADVTILLNTTAAGSDAIGFAAPVAVRTLEAPTDIAVLDVDGDGRPDIASANGIGGQGGGTWALLMNRSTRGGDKVAFRPSVRFVGGAPYGIAVTDMDLDGRPDVLVTLLAGTDTNAGSVSVLLNRSQPGDDNPPFVFAHSVPAGDEPHGIAAGDFNQDGLPDFAVTDFRPGRQAVQTSLQQREVQPLAVRDGTAVGRLRP